MKSKILIAMTTGRRTFKSTIDMLATNLSRNGHFDKHKIGVLINYDPSFLKISPEEFRYTGEYADLFDEILYIGPGDAHAYQSKMQAIGLSRPDSELISRAHGFGNKKNLILLNALSQNYEFVLFWDDDEYPVVCLEESDKIVWRQTDLLGAHLRALSGGADVTCGFWTGHIFPSVPGIDGILRKQTASMLGEALGIGTETHSAASFLCKENSFEIGREIPAIKEIKESRGGKWVSGGNLAIRLKSAFEGIVPPYYTPRDSRGDDTIFSLHLSQAKVMAVPGGAFHDMYLDHVSIAEGVYPDEIGFPSKNNFKYLERFAAALKAWLAYSPLFVRLSEKAGYKKKFRKMSGLLEKVDSTLYSEFPQLGNALGRQSLAGILEQYILQIDAQYEELRRSYDVWHELCRKI